MNESSNENDQCSSENHKRLSFSMEYKANALKLLKKTQWKC